MPPTKVRFPKYRHYHPKDLGVVRIAGHDHYLGKYDSPESWERYHRLVAEMLASRNRAASGEVSPPAVQTGQSLMMVPQSSPVVTTATATENAVLSINTLVNRYRVHAEEYYRKGGECTGEVDNIRYALRPLRKLYGSQPAASFDPDKLALIRESMIDAGLSRNVVNARVNRIKRLFSWAANHRPPLVPPAVFANLAVIKGQKCDRSRARETPRVKGVADEHISAVLPHLNQHVRAMVETENLTGMRPQEVCVLRTCDIDASSDIWVYTPSRHKCEHFGLTRLVAIGLRAQQVLAPFLKPSEPDAFIFSPREAVAEVHERQRKRPEKQNSVPDGSQRRKTRPARGPGQKYTKNSLGTAIARACKKAGVPRFGPNRLRHQCATRVRKRFGVEAAAAVLGHKMGLTAEIYSDVNFELAIEAMREIG